MIVDHEYKAPPGGGYLCGQVIDGSPCNVEWRLHYARDEVATDLLGWRYRVSLVIQDDLQGRQIGETMGCDRLEEILPFAGSIIYTISEDLKP